MPATTDVKLTRQIEKQSEQINYLKGRLSDLVDEIHLLRGELVNFKEAVSNDVSYLTERIAPPEER